MSDLKYREIQLRDILMKGLTLSHDNQLNRLPDEQIVENYKQWRIKAAHVLEATSRRGQ